MQLTTLHRARLLDRLDEQAGLSVLHAPSGAGKTTLLRTWASARAEHGHPVVWTTLTPDVVDRARLWAAIADSAEQAGVVGAEHVEALRRSATNPDETPAALRAMFAAHPGLTFVVDECDHVDADLDQIWTDLLTVVSEHPTARVLLATRWLLERRIEQLQQYQVVHLTGAAPLTFEVEETRALMKSAGLPDELVGQAERVTAETHGHPLAVVTGIEALARSAGITLSTRAADDQVLRDDLERVGVAGLVRATAFTPYVDVALASSLHGTSPAETTRLLQTIETNGLGHWREAPDGHRVLELTATVRATQAATATTVPADRALAVCDWLESHGDAAEALTVALATGQYARATSLYRRLLLTAPFSFTSGFEPALRSVPADELRRHPMLSVARGVALLSSPATASAALAYLEPIAEIDPATVREETADDELMDLTAQSVVLGVLGRHELASRAALEAAARLARPEFAQLVSPRLRTTLGCQLSQSLLDAGRVQEAQRLVTQGLAAADDETGHFCAVYGRALYGLDGRMPEALDMDRRLAPPGARPDPHAYGVSWGPRTQALEELGDGLMCLDRWDFAGAEAAVERSSNARWDHSGTWRAWLRLHVRLGRGDSTSEVHRVAALLEAAPAQPGSLGGAALANVMAVAWMVAGQWARAGRTLDEADAYLGQTAPARLMFELVTEGPEAAMKLLPEVREAEGHTIRSRGGLATVGAVAALRAGADQLAESLLREAAALHQAHGSRAHLLHLRAADLSALLGLARRLDSPECLAYLEGLTDLADLTSTAEPEALSEREQAVLEALAVHRSRSNVAAALHVSENTVKTQVRSIYRKLGVKDRAGAISRALELGLIGPDHTEVL